MNKVDSFTGNYRFLSNFYRTPIIYDGLTYQNAEAAFQAQKCKNREEKIKYALIENPVIAKRMGRKEKNIPENWDEISYEIMLNIVRAKFSNPQLAIKLLATGDDELIEGNLHHDNRWGKCFCDKCVLKVGSNQLGKILMQVRNELKRSRLHVRSHFGRYHRKPL